jgi:Fe-S-cluster-containing hydrogenase component 2
MKSCPAGAIQRDEKTGVVHVIHSKCTACEWCTKTCPIKGAIKIVSILGKAFKCDVCGGDPACVKHCPTGAIKLIKI